MKDFKAKIKDLVSSRDSMSTKNTGTTDDTTTIQVYANQSIQIKK